MEREDRHTPLPRQDAHKGRPYYGREIVISGTLPRKLGIWAVRRSIEADLFANKPTPVHNRDAA